MIRRFRCRPLVLALLALVLAIGPAGAAGPSPAAGPTELAPIFAGYWHEFLEHWGGLLKKQNGIIMTVLGIGVVSLIIITRGKWRK